MSAAGASALLRSGGRGIYVPEEDAAPRLYFLDLSFAPRGASQPKAYS